MLTIAQYPMQDYHRDVEQAAFSPGSLVPGIELSPDTLLNWRAFFYRDAQYTRLQSANIHQIPVNCPFLSKFHSPDNYWGSMRVDGDVAKKPTYVRGSGPREAVEADTAVPQQLPIDEPRLARPHVLAFGG
jgi:catalase